MKIKMLAEYYKYHEDIPRLFMVPTTNTLNRYHDKKRRLDYLRITKMLKDQNQQKGLTPRAEIYKPGKIESAPITDRILADLELSNATNVKSSEVMNGDDYRRGKNNRNQDFYQSNSEKSKHKSSKKEKENKNIKKPGTYQPNIKNPDNTMDQVKEVSISNTIQDLNLKLGEIINQSYSHFEASEYQSNNTISNLDNFLAYIQINHQGAKLHNIPEISSKPLLRKSVGSRLAKPETRVHTNNERVNTERMYTHTDRLLTERMVTERLDTHEGYNYYDPQNKLSQKRKQSRELNLAEKLLKEVPQDFFKKKTKKTEPDESAKIPEMERPYTGMVSSRHLTSSVVSSTTARPKNLPITVIKIQNFDDVLKGRQNSPLKLDSHRSVSREKVQQRPPSAISYRGYDSKPSKRQEGKGQEILALRRRSQATNGDTVDYSTKLTIRNKSIYNLKDIHLTEKATESSNLTTQQATERPNSQREMRISLDMNILGRHMSQPGTVTNTGNATGKSMKEMRGTPSTARISKGIPLHIGTHTSRESRHLTGSALMDLRDKGIKPTSSTHKRSLPQSQFNSQIEGSQMMSIIPEDMANLKQQVEKFTKKGMTHKEITPHHKHTKSEERFVGPTIVSLGRKGSIVQPETYREFNRSPYEGGKRVVKEKDNLLVKPPTYTYNHNNIVNIYVNHNDKNGNEPSPVLKKEPKRTGSLTERDRSTPSGAIKMSSRPSVPELFMKYNNASNPTSNSGKRLQTFESYGRKDDGRESPLKLTKKNEMKLNRPKSGNYGNSLNLLTQNQTKQSYQSKGNNKRVDIDLMDQKGKDANYEFMINFKKKQ